MVHPEQEEDHTEESLLAGMLKAPTRESPEFLAFDGGVDISALGLAPEKSSEKRAKVGRVWAQEGEDGEVPFESAVAEANGYQVETGAVVAHGVGEFGGQVEAVQGRGAPVRKVDMDGHPSDFCFRFRCFFLCNKKSPLLARSCVSSVLRSVRRSTSLPTPCT